jgi:tetratricopeptide (TPR) repeat protein
MLMERFHMPRVALRLATAVGLFGLAVGGYRQASAWRDSETLWRYTLSVTHDNAYAHANLGSVLMTQGDPVEAAEQARKALAIESHNIIALANLGTLLLDRGRSTEAIQLYERTVEFNPKFVLGWFFLGNAFQRAGRLNDAERAWRKAVEIEPGMAAAWGNLALLLIELQEPERAIDAAEKAVAAGGGEPARMTLERARSALGR